MTTDLDKLSEAATTGPWFWQEGFQNVYALSHQTSGETVHIAKANHEQVLGGFQTADTNAAFMVALVNAFRTGDLIPRATHEAAIAEARREEREAICSAIRREADLVGDDTEPLVEGQLSVIDLIAALPNPHDIKEEEG